MNQKELVKRLKVRKIEDDFWNYKDIAEMLDMKVTSLYCFLNGQFQISQSKAKKLKQWLDDLE